METTYIVKRRSSLMVKRPSRRGRVPASAVLAMRVGAGLFRNIADYEAEDIDLPEALKGRACVFEYRARDGVWRWGYAPHESQFLAEPLLRTVYKASSRGEAIAKAKAHVKRQRVEFRAQLEALWSTDHPGEGKDI